MINITLTYNYGFEWYNSDNITVKGYAYINDKLLEKRAFCDYFKGVEDEKSLKEITKKLNGCFAIVIQSNNKTFLITDTLRIFPLFYTKKNDVIYISDDVTTLKNNTGQYIVDKLRASEFKAGGIVSSCHTLIENVFQLEPGEIVSISANQSIKKLSYFDYTTNHTTKKSYQTLRKEFIEILEHSFHRMLKELNGRKIAVPLSGGYDSRLIAVLLKKFNYQNVICFTYGRLQNNNEVPISKKVAEKLGFQWHFVEYSKDLINGYFESDAFKSYYKYASNHTSQFFMQDYFAAQYMKDYNLTDDDTCFLPGYGGDFLGGSHITKYNLPNCLTKKNIPKRLFHFMYPYLTPPKKHKKQLLKNLKDYTNECFNREKDVYPYSVFENWDYKEKLIKSIFNAARPFDFFGHEFRFPYWDKALVDFFKHLPLQYKIDRLLYFDVMRNHYFSAYDLNFEKELQPSYKEYKIQYYKEVIKRYLPSSIKRLFYKINDKYNYEYITSFMIKEMQKKGKRIKTNVKHYNAIIAQWYVEQVRNNYRQ